MSDVISSEEDRRAAEDPLLQEAAKVGELLRLLSSVLEKSLSPKRMAEFLKSFDQHRDGVIEHLEHLQSRFEAEVDEAKNYSPAVCDFLVWHLGEAKRLVPLEIKTAEERSALASHFFDVAYRIFQAGTNPTELHLVPKLARFQQYELKRVRTRHKELSAREERRRYAWPETLQPRYQVPPYLNDQSNQIRREMSAQVGAHLKEFRKEVSELITSTAEKKALVKDIALDKNPNPQSTECRTAPQSDNEAENYAVSQDKTNQNSPSSSAKIPPKFRSKPISKQKAAKLLDKPNPDSGVEWLNQCISDGIITCESHSRQAHVFDIREFPEPVHDQLQ